MSVLEWTVVVIAIAIGLFFAVCWTLSFIEGIKNPYTIPIGKLKAPPAKKE